jgi:hypothetical protein
MESPEEVCGREVMLTSLYTGSKERDRMGLGPNIPWNRNLPMTYFPLIRHHLFKECTTSQECYRLGIKPLTCNIMGQFIQSIAHSM